MNAPRPARRECSRCGRPEVACFCALVTPIASARTRVVILQHRREAEVGIGTARMAHLCLPGSELFVGVDFDGDARVHAAIREPAYLLYPSADAVDVEDVCARTEGPLTLVVVDGTWWQAKNLVKRNASLAALPKVRFTPEMPSNYRIRREPADHCVATIEALVHVLGALEGDRERFRPMLRPFEHMVEMQLRYAREVHGSRERHAARRARHPRKPDLPALLRERAEDIVCVHGEANAWPIGREGGYPSEIVHWVAERIATGERFESVIAPRHPLAPSAPRYIGIARATLEAGETFAAFAARWQAFVRESDVFCSWGNHPLEVLARDGLELPRARLDLRNAAARWLHGNPGGLERFLSRLGLPPPTPWAPGRAGQRLALLVAGTRTRLPST